METLQKLIGAIATLLWPVITIVLVFMFRPAVKALIESAKTRKFTLKVGGQELTMEEANNAQQRLIADLQAKVADIQHTLPDSLSTKAGEPKIAPAVSRGAALLWVDDNPKNNAFFVQQLYDLGVIVDIAISTSSGNVHFNSKVYNYVISDMGRTEGGAFNPHAGIDFLKIVREKDKQIPFIIYSSPRAVTEYGSEAFRLGATAATSSATELFGLLHLRAAKANA